MIISLISEVIEDWIEKFEKKKKQPPESPFSKGDLKNSPLIKGIVCAGHLLHIKKSRFRKQPNLILSSFSKGAVKIVSFWSE